MSVQWNARNALWVSWPAGDDMEHLNVFIFFVLAQSLEAIRVNAQAGQPMSVFLTNVSIGKTAIDMLLEGQRYRLKESINAATTLRNTLNQIQSGTSGSPGLSEPLSPTETSQFLGNLGSFESALNTELGRAPIFFVKQKGVFDTSTLILKASMAYPDAIAERLPKDAISDTDEAGRCLAFSLGTAAGFHIARAVEAVIKGYMKAYGCPPLKDSQRNWGFYIRALTEHGAHAKVVAHLAQIKDLHRNPLIHPEVHLGLAEAVSLFAICTSAVQAMIADIERKLPSPDPMVMAMLPAHDAEAED
jgi:hypothetical protein